MKTKDFKTTSDPESDRIHPEVCPEFHREDVGKMLESWKHIMAIMGSAVCHDLNNPLQGVLGFVDLLMQTEQDSRRMEDLDFILDCSIQCRDFANDLGKLVEKHPMIHAEFDVEGLWEEVLAYCRLNWSEKKLHFKTSLKVISPPSGMDPHYFLAILFGVVGNACERAMEGTTITISLTVGGEGRLRMEARIDPEVKVASGGGDSASSFVSKSVARPDSERRRRDHSGIAGDHLLWLAKRAARLQQGRLEGGFNTAKGAVLVELPVLDV